MKTFLLSAVKRLKSYSQKLDAKAILYDKSWEVFNENGDKELMIFRTNQELLISRNGIIQKGKWELLDIANIIIDVGEKSYLFNASYIEDNFLALKLDGTEEYMVMIEADMMNRFSLNSVKSIESYLDNRYKKIEDDKAREQKRIEAIQQSKRDKEEALRLEAERERKEKEEEEEEERRIAYEQELETKAKENLIEKFSKENPMLFRKTLRKIIKLDLLNGRNRNKEWIATTKPQIYGYNLGAIAIVALIVGIFLESDSSMMNTIGYILGYPGIIVVSFGLIPDEKELIEEDYIAKYRILPLILHSIIFIILSFLTIALLSNPQDWTKLKKTEIFIFFACFCFAIKSFVSIFLNIKVIKEYYDIISSREWDYYKEKVYDEIIKYTKQNF